MMTLERILLDLLWQSTLLGLVIWLLASLVPLRRAMHRRAVLLAGLVAFAVLPAIALIPVSWRIEWRAPARLVSDVSQPERELSESRVPEKPPEVLALEPSDHTLGARATHVPPADAAIEVQAREAEARSVSPVSIARILAIVWLIGTALLIARLLLHAIALHRRSSGEPAGAHEQTALQEAAAALGLRRLPRLHLDEDTGQPLAYGLWRPTVVLPADLARQLERPALRDLLIHELGHVKRGDVAIGWLQCMVGALLWPQPFVRWLRRELDVAREVVCDDDVLRASGEASRYTRALLTVAEGVSSQERSALVAPALRRRGDLEQRVQLALDGERERPRSVDGFFRLGVAVPLVMALGLGSLFCAEQEKEPSLERSETGRQETSEEGATREESEAEEQERSALRRRVLIIEGAPRWEYRYLKNLLMQGLTWESGGQLEAAALQTWLTSADLGWDQDHSGDVPALSELPASLSEYQILILGAVDLEALERDWEEGFAEVLGWVRQGGRLLVLPGREAGLSAYAGTKLAAALPIRPPEAVADPVAELRWTGAGRASSLFQAWQPEGEARVDLAEVAIVPSGPAVEGAQVVLEEDAETAPRAIVAKSRYGEGTIAVLGLTDTWRLRHPAATVRHDTFWRALLSWLHEDSR